MRTLVEHVIANAAAATAMALAAVLIGLVVRRPAIRNALWVIVLVRLLVPPAWTVPVGMHPAQPDEALAVASARGDPILTPAPVPGEEWAPLFREDEVASGPPEPIAASPTAESAAPEAELSRPISAFTIAGIIWLAGTAVVFVRAARRIGRFNRALRDATPAPAAIHHQATEIARAIGLRSSPDIVLVHGRVSPAVWLPLLVAGRAKLILPAGLLAVLDADQRAAVLAHELAHLRRGDPWVRWLELVVAGLYWWFPLVGWFRRQLRAAEEECCDLRVVAVLGRRRDYATALVETAAFLGNSGAVPALASGAGPVRHLQWRVTMIMRASCPAGLTRLGLATVLGLGGLGLAFGPAVAQDRVDEPKRERGRDDETRRDRPRDADPRRDAAGRDVIEKLRAEVEAARRAAHEAVERLRAAEEALGRAEGRPVPPVPDARRDRGGPQPPPADRRPGSEAVPRLPRGEPPTPPAPPAPPGVPGRPGTAGPGPELRDLQTQIEELRRALDQMRQELRGARGERKETPPVRDPRSGKEKESTPRREREPVGRQ
jgi:beta-lactamase regulating signal transducer with metallopeptidase domain